VDRLDRRRVMVAADFLRSALVGFLGLAVFMDFASLPLLYAVFFVIGFAETFFDNAAVAMLPAVVEKTELDRANGRLFGARIVANELAAPPLGGVLFAFAAAIPFLLTAGFLAAAAALVMTMRGRFKVERVEGSPCTTLRAEISEGVRWLFGHRLLRTLAFSMAVMNVTLSSALSIMVLVAQERLGLGPVGYGILLSSIAIGGIIGSLTAERIVARFGPGTAMRIGLVIEAATHLVIALSTDALVVGATLAVFGLHAVVWSVISVSLRQRIAPGRLLGRVNSAYMVFSAGSVSIGALLGGVLASYLGLTAPFWFSFFVIAALAALIWRILDNDAINSARE
ncbi:MAG: MFS transporter, partial [Rubrobacteraceae bacterium]